MSTQVFLAPMGISVDSVRDGVNLAQLRALMTSQDYSRALHISDADKVRLWGCHDGTRSRWEAMQADDVVLFAPTGVGMFTDMGRVAFKIENADIAKFLMRLGVWPMSNFRYIFFVKDHRSINIPKSQIASLGGWKRVGPPQSFMRIASQKVADSIIHLLESVLTNSA
jgi:hypothetical protein